MDIQTVQAIGQIISWSTVSIGYICLFGFVYFLLKK